MNDGQICPTHRISEAFIPSSGISKSQEDAPQLGSTGVAKDSGLRVGEASSASEYFSCFSSPRKLIRGGKGAGLLGCRTHWVWGAKHTDPREVRGNPRQSSDQGSVEEPGQEGRAVRRVWI